MEQIKYRKRIFYFTNFDVNDKFAVVIRASFSATTPIRNAKEKYSLFVPNTFSTWKMSIVR